MKLGVNMQQTMSRAVNQLYRVNKQTLCAVLSLFLLFIPFNLKAVIKQYDEAVSLGTACQSAWQLEANGMRKLAYPFDWLITPFDSLVSFITCRGVNFLDKDKLAVVEVLPGNPSMLHIVDLLYNIHSIHDFYGPDMSNYDAVKAKYDRRIKRFFNLLDSNKKILFVRVQISRSEAEEIDRLFQTFYPKLRYTLVAVSEDPNAQFDWGLERVKNFYMQQIPGDWAGNHEKWETILSQFPVKPASKSRRAEERW